MKLKNIIILVAMFISTAGFAQEKLSLKAFYMGYDEENQTYSFEAVDGVNTEFTNVLDAVLKEYDLMSEELIDKPFSIIYTVNKSQEEEDVYEEFTIISLKPTVLFRVENDEDDDEEE